MKRFPAKVVSLVLALAMSLSLLTVSTVAEENGWWTEEIWDAETLISLGAKPPLFNKKTGCYEIETPEQLLYLSGNWKSTDTNGDGQPDAPRNGHYVLTADLDMGPLMKKIGKTITEASGKETDGYMLPLSANKKENADKTDGWFMGTIDGQYHTISNLRICRQNGKYTGLVGYLGNETLTTPTIRNLGLINLKMEGKKSCGAFAGVCFGTVENCFATGTIKAKEAVGGLVGKCEGELRNCVSYMKVKGKSLVGGLVGNILGGAVENCYVGGSVTVSGGKASAGGVAGTFAVATYLRNVASVIREVSGDEGASDIDRLVGTLESESGTNITNNYIWEGAILNGNAPVEHPNRSIAQAVSAETLMSRSLYEKNLGWEFNKIWSWVGTSAQGYPMLTGFVKAGKAPDLLEEILTDLTIKQPVLLIDDPVVNWVAKGEQATIHARLSLPEGTKVDSIKVFYGENSDGKTFKDFVEMTVNKDSYQAVLPLKNPGSYHYFVSANVDGQIITVPADISASLPLQLDDGVVDATPREVLCQLGETYQEVGFNWITDPAVKDSKVWYRGKGDSTWNVTDGESVRHYLTEGWEEIQSHWATITGLAAETTYEYAVGGIYDGKEVRGDIHTFTTLPASGAFTFMQYGDLQAKKPEGYDPFLNTMEQFVNTLPVQPDFLLNTGDIVDAGYKSTQWASFFDVAETYMADRLNILLPGNHENTGDLLYKQYGARTSLPNELEYGPLEGTGWCVVGDACFVFVNADPYSGQVGADVEADRARFFTEQTAWAKTVYEKADKTWRIMASHVGTYIVNFNDPSDYPYIPEMCDELQVDLYLNGHDHEYIRTTTKDNVICPIGSGTTYMTCSSLGEKLDAFEPGTAGGKYAVVHKDGADNSQQIFSMVTVDGNGIHATAYQRGVEEDWSKFDIIDHYDITTSLTKGSQTPTEVTEPAGPEITVLPTYTVQPGDCLYRIAKMLYGNGEKWNDLYEANRNIISDPACIYIGQVLRIPAK